MRSRAWYVPPAGRYRVRDCFNERELGEEAAPGASLPLAFEHFLLLKAIPV